MPRRTFALVYFNDLRCGSFRGAALSHYQGPRPRAWRSRKGTRRRGSGALAFGGARRGTHREDGWWRRPPCIYFEYARAPRNCLDGNRPRMVEASGVTMTFRNDSNQQGGPRVRIPVPFKAVCRFPPGAASPAPVGTPTQRWF
jgi:hypothetical protein